MTGSTLSPVRRRACPSRARSAGAADCRRPRRSGRRPSKPLWAEAAASGIVRIAAGADRPDYPSGKLRRARVTTRGHRENTSRDSDLSVHQKGGNPNLSRLQCGRRGDAGVRPLGFPQSLGAERPLLLSLAHQRDEAGRSALAELVDAGVRMTKQASHGDKQCMPPLPYKLGGSASLARQQFQTDVGFFRLTGGEGGDSPLSPCITLSDRGLAEPPEDVVYHCRAP